VWVYVRLCDRVCGRVSSSCVCVCVSVSSCLWLVVCLIMCVVMVISGRECVRVFVPAINYVCSRGCCRGRLGHV